MVYVPNLTFGFGVSSLSFGTSPFAEEVVEEMLSVVVFGD
jgi:hypothetical protein